MIRPCHNFCVSTFGETVLEFAVQLNRVDSDGAHHDRERKHGSIDLFKCESWSLDHCSSGCNIVVCDRWIQGAGDVAGHTFEQTRRQRNKFAPDCAKMEAPCKGEGGYRNALKVKEDQHEDERVFQSLQNSHEAAGLKFV